jgi:hypothetical protein
MRGRIVLLVPQPIVAVVLRRHVLRMLSVSVRIRNGKVARYCYDAKYPVEHCLIVERHIFRYSTRLRVIVLMCHIGPLRAHNGHQSHVFEGDITLGYSCWALLVHEFAIAVNLSLMIRVEMMAAMRGLGFHELRLFAQQGRTGCPSLVNPGR